MKLVVQRVRQASVSVGGETVGSIQEGLLVLVGIHRRDTAIDGAEMAKKLLSLRLFPGCSGGERWKGSLQDGNGRMVLLVSQFTLYGSTEKGTGVDFHEAMAGDQALGVFNDFVEKVKERVGEAMVRTGSFGQHMQVSLVNDGPVTVILESKAYRRQSG